MLAYRLRAPIPYLPTLFILIKTRIIQYSQHVKAILGLSIYSYHIPTLTKSVPNRLNLWIGLQPKPEPK
jgi:hypothetical protein